MTDKQKRAMSKRMKQVHKANKTAKSQSNDIALGLLKTVVKLLGGKS